MVSGGGSIVGKKDFDIFVKTLAQKVQTDDYFCPSQVADFEKAFQCLTKLSDCSSQQVVTLVLLNALRIT